MEEVEELKESVVEKEGKGSSEAKEKNENRAVRKERLAVPRGPALEQSHSPALFLVYHEALSSSHGGAFAGSSSITHRTSPSIKITFT